MNRNLIFPLFVLNAWKGEHAPAHVYKGSSVKHVLKNKRSMSIGQRRKELSSLKYKGSVWSIGSKNMTQELKEPQSLVRNKSKNKK